MGMESGFVLVACGDAEQVVGMAKVQFGVNTLTDLVLGHPGIYSNLLELQHAIMYFTTLRRHLTRANAGLSS
jgi:hypothetical protein